MSFSLGLGSFGALGALGAFSALAGLAALPCLVLSARAGGVLIREERDGDLRADLLIRNLDEVIRELIDAPSDGSGPSLAWLASLIGVMGSSRSESENQ